MHIESIFPNRIGDLLMNLLASSAVRTARKLFVTFTLALGMTLGQNTPAQAQSVDPCTVFICMAGISGFGATGGPACIPAIALWHTPEVLAIYDELGFDVPASIAVREAYLLSCPGVVGPNIAIEEAIMAEWGSEP
jgi:hypothetical protein